MRLTSSAFADGEPMPPDCAFSFVTPDRRYVDAPNRNPDLRWHDLPPGTRSLVLINDDLDVPADLSGYGKADTEFTDETPRRRLCHWVLVDLDPAGPPIRRGEFSDGVTPRGKAGPAGPRGTRQGVNEYTVHFADDPEMAGTYHGYDGPRPPWNDRRPHRYEFLMIAVDVPRVAVQGSFDKADVLAALEGHVISAATLTGTFTTHVVDDGPPPG